METSVNNKNDIQVHLVNYIILILQGQEPFKWYSDKWYLCLAFHTWFSSVFHVKFGHTTSDNVITISDFPKPALVALKGRFMIWLNRTILYDSVWFRIILYRLIITAVVIINLEQLISKFLVGVRAIILYGSVQIFSE